MAFETIPQPTTYEERLAIAERTRDEFDLRCEIVVDGMDDRSRAFFGDQPNSLFVIGPDAFIRLKQPWADPDELSEFLPEFLEAAGEKLDVDADTELRSRVARVLLDRDPAGRESLLESWDRLTILRSDATDPMQNERLKFALRLADYTPEAETLGRMLARGRGAFELDAFRTAEDEGPPVDRRLALGSMLVPVLEQSAGDARTMLIAFLRELLPSDGRAEQWLAGFEVDAGEPDQGGN